MMRIKEEFAENRKTEIKSFKKKYFIVSEGIKTEPKYFSKLNETMLSENVTIINILRDYKDLNKSNPVQILELLKLFLDNIENGISVIELKNKLSNFNHENKNFINLTEVYRKIDKIYPNSKFNLSNEELEKLFVYLFKNECYENAMKSFKYYLDKKDIVYVPDYDSFNLVIDRDKDSFTDEQYINVVTSCKENNINCYVSNPCFELWLLMHFDEFDNEKKEILLENRKISKRRYLEKRLNEICGYSKNNIKFELLKPGVFKAIEREKRFTEDINELKDELGTNVGILVNDILTNE